MDQPQYSTLMDALKKVPDPRKARGKQYPWSLLLALACGALVSGQKTGHAIAHWIVLRAAELQERLRPPRDRLPSESTMRRMLQAIDVEALERQLTGYTECLAAQTSKTGPITSPTGEELQGQAIDGKELRGVRAHGRPLYLVSLTCHGSGIVLAQAAVDQKSNEITAVPRLLAGRDLQSVVITVDALLCQRNLAQKILGQGGHYLMVVKENQPELYKAIALLFEQPPWLRQERAAEYQVCTTANKGHGRRERRTLESSPTLCHYLDWPGVGQVLRRQCQRVILPGEYAQGEYRKTGQVSTETTYGITSLTPAQAGAAQVEALQGTDLHTVWRGHWTIENPLHYVRDVTMGEDAGQMHTGNAPHALAALRNGIINLLRRTGWTNIADALRYYDASVQRALALIGAAPT